MLRRTLKKNVRIAPSSVPKNPVDLNDLDEIIESLSNASSEVNSNTFVRNSKFRKSVNKGRNSHEKYDNFVRGPIINRDIPNSKPLFDPLEPPITRLVQMSAQSSDKRYIKAHLRNDKVFDKIRLYLAFFCDKAPSVTYNGYTRMKILTDLSNEGIPMDHNFLTEIYYDFMKDKGFNNKEISEELKAYGEAIKWDRIKYLRERDYLYKSHYGAHSKNFH